MGIQIANLEEMEIARCQFIVKLVTSDGQKFEDLFSEVLGLSNTNFRPVKPQGSLGDRKNDGFDNVKGTYYQVYAPENLKLRQADALKKLKTDFLGLYNFWEKNNGFIIKSFYYVLNDKYKGAFPETEVALNELKQIYKDKLFDLFLCKHLEDVFLQLSIKDMCRVIGFIPSKDKVGKVDYSVLKQVVDYLLENMAPYSSNESYPTDPNFELKIKFNNLGNVPSGLLNIANIQRGKVEDYFKINSTFAKKRLQKKFSELYKEALKIFDLKTQADLIFFYILEKSFPKQDKLTQDAVLVLMAYYFEACDIFEEPKK